MSQIMTATDAKTRLSESVAMVQRTARSRRHQPHRKPAAVLVSHAELEALRETIAILSDTEAVEDIRQGETDVAAGTTTNAEDLREAMRARRAAGH